MIKITIEDHTRCRLVPKSTTLDEHEVNKQSHGFKTHAPWCCYVIHIVSYSRQWMTSADV